jgi:ketosteroid isomerase-like protein
MASIERQILRANQAFYAAFATGDIEAMDELWAHYTPVVCIHPGWPAQIGRQDVMASWRAILLGGSVPKFRVDEDRAFAVGETGYVTCKEHFPDRILVASNFFVREDGLWQIVHHHAGPIAAPDERPGERTIN